MIGLEWLEAASYLVTIIGLPLAIGVYVYDRRRDQQTDEEEIFLRLSDEYADFMRLVIDNADLHLLSPAAKGASPHTTPTATLESTIVGAGDSGGVSSKSTRVSATPKPAASTACAKKKAIAKGSAADPVAARNASPT